jgi:hypothetical protein
MFASLMVALLAGLVASAAASEPVGAASGTGRTESRSVLARVAIEDVPGHELVQTVGEDLVTTPDRIAGVSFESSRMKRHDQADLVDGSGLVRGYGVWEASSGEKLYVTYGYRIPPFSAETGDVVPFEGGFEWTGGTGRLAAVRGSGTIQGQMSRSGKASYRWSGTYRTVESSAR